MVSKSSEKPGAPGTASPARQIIHLDMDAFYASVEVLDNPALRGQPVIVGGGRERGVVSAASYEARRFGIHSAMPIAHALRLCPQGIFLPPRINRYSEISKQIFSIFEQYTPLVEPLSLDEAFLDVSNSSRLFGAAPAIAARIKQQVAAETGLTVSAGVAASKLVAKIASDFRKPDGLTVVASGSEAEFLAPLPIKRLWGVGKTTQEILALLGVKTIGDLRLLPLELLTGKLGRHGHHLYMAARGLDDRDVTPEREMKSVGNEETFDNDIIDIKRLHQELLYLADKVGRRLRRYEAKGCTVTVKVKFHDFKQVSRSTTLPAAVDDHQTIYAAAKDLLSRTVAGKKPVRLLGISISQLRFQGESYQQSLFESPGGNRRDRLNEALDQVNSKFGATAIVPASLLDS